MSSETLRTKFINRKTQKTNNRLITVDAELKSINTYKKLILYTECKSSMEQLLKLDKSYQKEDSKSPIWIADESDNGLYLRVSVPKFKHDNLFKYNSMTGQLIKLKLSHKSYDDPQIGKGWFLSLASDIKKVTIN